MSINGANIAGTWTRSATTASSYDFNNHTPTGDALNMIMVVTYDAGGSPSQPNSVGGTNGWNVTWTHLGGAQDDNDGNFRYDVYYADKATIGASPTQGNISIGYAASQDGCHVGVTSWAGDSGEDPQPSAFTVGVGGNGTSISISLAGGAPAGVTVGAVGADESSISTDTNFEDGLTPSGGFLGRYSIFTWDDTEPGQHPVRAAWNTSADYFGLGFAIDDAAVTFGVRTTYNNDIQG